MFNQIPMTETVIPLSKVRPGRYQHRQTFKPDKLLELAGSIRENGLINPPLVYRQNGHYELLAGERRWRAMCALAMADPSVAGQAALSLEQAVGLVATVQPPAPGHQEKLGQVTIPVRLCEGDATTLQTLAAVENLQREDLTPLEEARDFAALRELGHSNVRIARLTGKSLPHITGMLKWLDLEPQIGQLMDEGLLHKDVRVAEALLSVKDAGLRLRLARQFVDRRSPIKAIMAVCKRANSWPHSAAVNGSAVPVSQVAVQMAAPAPLQDPAPTPNATLADRTCFCPACAVHIQELAEELCGGCRAHGLTAGCLNCEGVIEFINRLVRLSEAAYV